jgi:hypothetical protein
MHRKLSFFVLILQKNGKKMLTVCECLFVSTSEGEGDDDDDDDDEDVLLS